MMEEYSNKVLSIFGIFSAGIAGLWREWRKEVRLNREDNKEHAKVYVRTLEVLARVEKTLDSVDRKLGNEKS